MKIGGRQLNNPSSAFAEPAEIDNGLASGDGDLPDIGTFGFLALLPYWLLISLLALMRPDWLPVLGWVGLGVPFFLLYLSGLTLPHMWPRRMHIGIYFFAAVAGFALLAVLTILFVGAALGLFVLADQLGYQALVSSSGALDFVIMLLMVFAATIASRVVARLHASLLGLGPEDPEAQSLRLAHTMSGLFLAAVSGMICLPEIEGVKLTYVSPMTAYLALMIAAIPYPICLWMSLNRIGFGPSRTPSYAMLIVLLGIIWVAGMSTSYVLQKLSGPVSPFATFVWPFQAIMSLAGT